MDAKRLKKIYRNMLARCQNPRHQAYAKYGGRGITVCAAWMDAETGWPTFANWAYQHGYRDNLTIDRRDNDGGYAPDNCRWATAAQQAQNRSTTKHITVDGVTDCPAGWNRVLGLSQNAIYDAARRGIPPQVYINQKLLQRRT